MRRIELTALFAGLALLVVPHGARAEDTKAMPGAQAVATPKAVVELFTSQGCSSCPAADAVMGRVVARRNDVVALTLSTDIWDYLGWKDTLSSPRFGERHKAYAKAFKDMLYTPQAVINGAVHINGADEALLNRKIDNLPGPRVPIRVWEEAGKLHIETSGNEAAAAKNATLWIAVVADQVTVPITRGENSGKTLTYYNVVREITPVGMWTGKSMSVQFERASIARPDTNRCAVLLQEGQGGPIIGAAMLDRF
jgi:hypothetical protein